MCHLNCMFKETGSRCLHSLGAGGLSLAVEGPSKAEISCKDNKDGTCTVSYLPTAAGDYNIIVKFDDKHIPGSPFTAKITGEQLFLVCPHICLYCVCVRIVVRKWSHMPRCSSLCIRLLCPHVPFFSMWYLRISLFFKFGTDVKF